KSGQTACSLCGYNTHARWANSSSCEPCPWPSFTYYGYKGSIECEVCPFGQFRMQRPDIALCVQCPDDTTCWNGIIFGSVKPGVYIYFWRQENNVSAVEFPIAVPQLYPCPVEACPGGWVRSQCGQNRRQDYANLLCAECN